MRKQKLTLEAVALRDGAPASLKNFSIEQAAALLGVGRTYLYGLISERKIKTVRLGRRRLIPGLALQEYMTELAKTAA